jgi:hypothetical protein
LGTKRPTLELGEEMATVAEETKAIYITRTARDVMEQIANEERFKNKPVGKLLDYLVKLWDESQAV